jgi:cytochrome c1
MAKRMKALRDTLAVIGLATALMSGAALAAGQKDAKDVSFSFEGPFGKFDKAQLQRGYRVYKEVCSQCHALKYVAFRHLGDPGALGYEAEQIEALAATFKVQDGPDASGNMFERAGIPSDHFPSPFPNEQAAASSNGGAVPPDLSLLTKSRPGWYGTINQFINGIGGPEYVYSVLTGYEEPSAEIEAETPEGKYYNPYFAAGHFISMPPAGTLSDGLVPYDDGTPNTVDNMAKDVAAFLAWTAEPKMEERKRVGFGVMLFLAIFAAMLYLVKKKLWADQH